MVDDEPSSRSSLGWMLTDSDLEPVPLDGPLHELSETRDLVRARADALICDHHLSVRNYARFSGAELVAQSIRGGFPALLCTRFIRTDIDSIRPLLGWVPVIRTPDELNEPDELRAALADCAAELAGERPPERKTWRTQLVVERVDSVDESFDASFPAWEIEETVRIRLQDVPTAIQPQIKIGFRTHVSANIGARESDLLFVEEWI